jgi:hypothetical protein
LARHESSEQFTHGLYYTVLYHNHVRLTHTRPLICCDLLNRLTNLFLATRASVELAGFMCLFPPQRRMHDGRQKATEMDRIAPSSHDTYVGCSLASSTCPPSVALRIPQSSSDFGSALIKMQSHTRCINRLLYGTKASALTLPATSIHPSTPACSLLMATSKSASDLLEQCSSADSSCCVCSVYATLHQVGRRLTGSVADGTSCGFDSRAGGSYKRLKLGLLV